MGMTLGLAVVSDETIARLHEYPPLVWQVVAPNDPEAAAEAAAPRRPGLLARLFGRPAPPSKPVPPLVLGKGEGEGVDLDKAWHGLHYLLTGTAWEGEPPLNVLAAGGREVGTEYMARLREAVQSVVARASLIRHPGSEIQRGC